MQISDVNINFIKPQHGLIGFASMILDDAIYISGIAIHQKLNGNGYRLTYPTRKSGGQGFDIFHPINKDASAAIERAVFRKLKDVMNKVSPHDRYNSDKPTAQ